MADQPIPLDDLKQRIIDSGLLSTDEVETAESTIAPAPESSESFARELVRRASLSDFQAEVLLDGRDQPLVLDKYVITDRIGTGGMGEVFKARHRKSGDVVALKSIKFDFADDELAGKRFDREVRIAQALDNEHIVKARVTLRRETDRGW